MSLVMLYVKEWGLESGKWEWGVESGEWGLWNQKWKVQSREEREWRVEWGECRMRNGKRRGES